MTFEDLDTWQKARQSTRHTHSLTEDTRARESAVYTGQLPNDPVHSA
jgi:hypothetical protein